MSDGLTFRPFRGLRYDPARVGPLSAVTCPPYDVLDAATATRLAAHPFSVVRLVLPHCLDPADPAPHAAAAARLADWRRQGVLRTDRVPAFYLYEETDGGRVHRGLLGALAIPPAESGVVLPHEHTRAATVADRLALLTATEADLEPILLIPEDPGEVFSTAFGDDDGRGRGEGPLTQPPVEPPIEFDSEDGVHHRLWALTDPSVTAAVSARLRTTPALLADGHHRYEAARRLHPRGDTLALLAEPASAPRLNAIHRVVPGLPATVAADKAASAFAVDAVPSRDPAALVERLARAGQTGHAFAIADAESAYLLVGPDERTLTATLPRAHAPVWRELDVAIAHAALLRALWHVPDDEDHVEVCFAADEALWRAAQLGGTALLLNPPALATITAVARAGERMPRKSTFFTPKPRTGLVLRPFVDPPASG